MSDAAKHGMKKAQADLSCHFFSFAQDNDITEGWFLHAMQNEEEDADDLGFTQPISSRRWSSIILETILPRVTRVVESSCLSEMNRYVDGETLELLG